MNFNYFLDEDSFTYLLDAVTFVAKKGYRFLPLYCYCPRGGAVDSSRRRGGRVGPGQRL